MGGDTTKEEGVPSSMMAKYKLKKYKKIKVQATNKLFQEYWHVAF